MLRPGPGLRALLAAAWLTAGSVASADVDVTVRPGDKVLGTVAPAAETETVRVYAVAGSVVTGKAKAAKGGGELRVRAEDADAGALGDGTGRAVAIPRTTLGPDGELVVTVASADGATESAYTLRVKTTPPRKATAAVQVGGVGGSVDIGAEAGMRITLSARTDTPGAAFRIDGVDGPAGFEVDTGSTDEGAATDAAAPFVAPFAGTYTVRFGNTGGIPCEVALTVARKRAKAAPRTVDVRSGAIGGSGEESAVAGVIGAEGGAVVVPDLGLSGGLDDISGAGVAFPAGALAFPTTVVVASAASLGIAGSIGSLGPAVFFGPEGTDFGAAARVTIPFDSALVGGVTTDVTVYVRDSRGRVTQVTLDAQSFATPGFVSFAATHFSSYQAFARPGFSLPNPLTVATVSGAADLAPKQTAGATSPPPVFVAGGAARTVSRITFGTTSPIGAVERFAGGGSSSADGTARLDFLFPGDVTCVATRPDSEEVYVGAGAAVYRIASDGTVTRVVGTGAQGDSGDNGPPVAALIRGADDLLVDNLGGMLICDRQSARVRFVMSGGNIVTEFGTGVSALGADTDPVTSTTLLSPRALAHSGASILVGDGARIRLLNRGNGTNTTIAGDAAGGTGMVTGPVTATAARFTTVSSVFNDQPRNRIYVADSAAHVIVVVDTSQAPATADLVAGVPGVSSSSPDGSTAPFPVFAPLSVIGGGTDVVRFAESDGRIRLFDFVP